LTPIGLAEASQVPVGTTRDYEKGKREPLLSNAQKLATALGVSLDRLAAGTDEPKPRKRASKPEK